MKGRVHLIQDEEESLEVRKRQVRPSGHQRRVDSEMVKAHVQRLREVVRMLPPLDLES